MDRRGDRFLTRSARAVDEYGHIALRSHRDLFVNLLHGRGRPKERIKIPRLDGLCGQGKIDLLCKRFGKRLESIRLRRLQVTRAILLFVCDLIMLIQFILIRLV